MILRFLPEANIIPFKAFSITGNKGLVESVNHSGLVPTLTYLTKARVLTDF
jgi:hypothetical protein